MKNGEEHCSAGKVMSAGSSVLISVPHTSARHEARAVGMALKRSGLNVHYVGEAHLAERELGTAGGAVNEASGLSLKNARLRRLMMRNEFVLALALMSKLLIDRLQMKRLLAREAPAVVVIFDDRSWLNFLMAHTARGMNIRIVMVPFAFSSLESDVFMRRGRSGHRVGKVWQAIIWKLLLQNCSDQLQRGPDGKMLSFYTVWETLALAGSGVLPSRPWTCGASQPDIVVAINQAHCAYLLSGGVDEKAVVLCGQPSTDALFMSREAHKVRREEIQKNYGLDPARLLIACAVPQYAEHGLTTWEQHETLTRELFAELAASGADVLLSLHPRSNPAHYEKLARHAGLLIARDSLTHVLPVADLLVSAFSSTTNWAIGLGVPAFVVDAIGFDYKAFDNLKGVVPFDGYAALGNQLRVFVRDVSCREKLRDDAREQSELSGPIDGGAGERVANVVMTLAAGRLPQYEAGSSDHRGCKSSHPQCPKSSIPPDLVSL